MWGVRECVQLTGKRTGSLARGTAENVQLQLYNIKTLKHVHMEKTWKSFTNVSEKLKVGSSVALVPQAIQQPNTLPPNTWSQALRLSRPGLVSTLQVLSQTQTNSYSPPNNFMKLKPLISPHHLIPPWSPLETWILHCQHTVYTQSGQPCWLDNTPLFVRHFHYH